MYEFVNTEKFIKRSRKIHNNKYNYVLSKYTCSNGIVEIICPIHGIFKQRAIKHLIGQGCELCSNETTKNKTRMSHAEFSNKVFKNFPNIFIKSLYTGNKNKVLIEDKHGIEYLFLPSDLLKGVYPSIKSAINKNKAFEIKANLIHNNRYLYNEVVYKGHAIKVNIICPTHGIFAQTPGNHLNGIICPKCSLRLDYSKSQWIKVCNNSENCIPLVYIIRCYNDDEEFIKIGITSRSIYDRFKYGMLPYSYEVIKEIKGSPDFVYDKEKELHKLYYKDKYKPFKYFGGNTECFNINILSKIMST